MFIIWNSNYYNVIGVVVGGRLNHGHTMARPLFQSLTLSSDGCDGLKIIILSREISRHSIRFLCGSSQLLLLLLAETLHY